MLMVGRDEQIIVGVLVCTSAAHFGPKIAHPKVYLYGMFFVNIGESRRSRIMDIIIMLMGRKETRESGVI